MTITVWPANAVSGSPTYAGRALRQTTTAPFVAGATAARPLGARSGVRPGTSTSSVTASTTAWSVAAFAGVIDGEAANEAGPYTFASDAVVTGALTAANASNPRVDIVYVQVSDPAESDGSTTPGVSIAYLAGTAAATPTAPTTPARSFVLAQINVPKSGGGNPSVVWVAPFMSAAGGVLPVASYTALTAITGVNGQHAQVYADPTDQVNGDYYWNTSTGTWQRSGLKIIGNVGGALRGGTAPNGMGALVQTGSTVVTTNAGGDTTIAFAQAFPNGLMSFVGMSGDSTTGRFTIAVNTTGGSQSSINLTLAREGSAVASQTVRITWIAIGW